jgi:tRNA A-37 threonylcarbamoyl transferase component Bud32
MARQLDDFLILFFSLHFLGDLGVLAVAHRRDKNRRCVYNRFVAQAQLEQALRNFREHARLIKGGEQREVWQFDFENRRYELIFYPRLLRRRGWRTPSAVREFFNLQRLQREKIPSPRAVAQMSGFSIDQRIGDALIVEALDDAIDVETLFRDAALAGEQVQNRREIAEQMVQLIQQIAQLKLGHRDLRLSSFLLSGGKIYFQDADGLISGGMKLNQIFRFAHNASRFATRSELLRGWKLLNPGATLPRKNPMSKRLWREFVRRTRRENEDFGIFRSGKWSGYFTKSARFGQPWSSASRLDVNRNDWEKVWPTLLRRIDANELQLLKGDASGEVFAGQIELAGKTIEIIVKRPRRKFWYRYLMDLFRPARAERMWHKAWTLIGRNFPCEFPMILMQRKVLGYALDGIAVFERVPGERLDQVDLNALEPAKREMLFRRAGRMLRGIERGGLVNYDSKSTNWIVYEDQKHGAIPVTIDVDGIRPLNYWLSAWGIRRLLRAMKQHPQYTPADSLALCQGYAPGAKAIAEENVEEKAE